MAKPEKAKREQDDEVPVESIAETENYVAWLSQEPDGETVYHLELGSVTLHFFREEFDEVLQLLDDARTALRG
ncbi:MAG TPA: hypothetical protein VER79_01410 [Candidatus Limnocylindrales bacterium]|nr:hypothetical protein [Candidatus Limnocylindrales bacterium]